WVASHRCSFWLQFLAPLCSFLQPPPSQALLRPAPTPQSQVGPDEVPRRWHDTACGFRHIVCTLLDPARLHTEWTERNAGMFAPQLLTSLRSYSKQQFVTDVLAGGVVGVVALPLAMAFAIASGVTPEKGLYTAIVAGFLISALGGSRVQIGGPTGAFVVLVYDIVQRHGLDGLALCTFMAGGILLLMGLLKLGSVIKFIPFPVITGFTSGIAIIIFTSQVKDLLGLTTGALPGDVLGKWAGYLNHIGTIC